MNVTLALVLSDNDSDSYQLALTLLQRQPTVREGQSPQQQPTFVVSNKTMKLEAIVNHETFRIHSTCIVVSPAQAQHLHKAQAFKQLRHVMLHIALLHCSKLFIINNKYNYFSLNLQSALTTDFINHHNVLLCRLNVGYAAKLNVASWSSTTVICYFDSMLLSSSPFSSVVCSTKAPPTGVGDVLQLSQSDSLGSCARDVKSGQV